MRIVFAIALLAPSLAAADNRELVLSPAIAGATERDVVKAAIRADDRCQPDCALDIDAQTILPNGIRFAVQHSTNSGFGGAGYVVTFTSDAGVALWQTADTGKFRNPAVFVTKESGGMGKTWTEKLDRLGIVRTKDMVWVHFAVTSEVHYYGIDELRPETVTTTHLQYAIGCRYDAAPACAAVVAPDLVSDSTIEISGATATQRWTSYDHKRRVDRVTLVAPPPR